MEVIWKLHARLQIFHLDVPYRSECGDLILQEGNQGHRFDRYTENLLVVAADPDEGAAQTEKEEAVYCSNLFNCK